MAGGYTLVLIAVFGVLGIETTSFAALIAARAINDVGGEAGYPAPETRMAVRNV